MSQRSIDRPPETAELDVVAHAAQLIEFHANTTGGVTELEARVGF